MSNNNDDLEEFRKKLIEQNKKFYSERFSSEGVERREPFFSFIPFDPSLSLIIADFNLSSAAPSTVLFFSNGFLVDYDLSNPIYLEDRVCNQSLPARIVRKLGSIFKSEPLKNCGIEKGVSEEVLRWDETKVDVTGNLEYLVRLAHIFGVPRVCIVNPSNFVFQGIPERSGNVKIDLVRDFSDDYEYRAAYQVLKNLLILRYLRVYQDGALYKYLQEVELEQSTSGIGRPKNSHPLVCLAATLCLSLMVDEDGGMTYIGGI